MTEKLTDTVFSIIIVNYNSGALLTGCLASIFQNLEEGYEIIIYDNASSDASLSRIAAQFPGDKRIRIVEGKENLGFAKANNLAARVSSGKYLHFLNPDIVVNSALAGDYRTIAQDDLDGVYVTSLASEDGHLLKNRHIIPTLGNYWICIFNKKKVAYWNIGASLIIRRESFERIGGWPEDYFMYAEDMDLFYILHRDHIPVTYFDTRLVHIGKGTTRQIWSESQRALKVELSFRRFFRKHDIPLQYFVIRPILLLFVLFHEPGGFYLQVKTFIRVLFIRTR
ncbi:MAG: glycosyltransferase family 2 protein [Bacteroidetes bacterium]|nr:glycosyltransferase family 2 protein [Bacteroidota bacterium]